MRNAAHDLWTVDDNFIDQPGLKFERQFNPLIEATVEQWGCYQFDNAKVPHKMFAFVDRFVRMLGIPWSKFSSIENVCNELLHRIEYDEPYFFLMDMRVQLYHGETLHTYRHRATGDILDPSRVEVFKLDRSWDYKPYYAVKNMMEHPGMQAFLSGTAIPPGCKDRREAMPKVLAKISEVVWGPFGWIESLVTDMVTSYEEGEAYNSDHIKDAREREEFASALVFDYPFWVASALGVMTWLKGPEALEFLIQYHIVYDRIFDIHDDGTIGLHSGTGDEVIVEGCNVYTHRELEKIEYRRPDSCVRCGTHVHCTKYVNLTALAHKTCSCGNDINPLDSNETLQTEHGFRRSCQAYFQQHPPRYGFMCQRCLFMSVQGMTEDIQCGRVTCPATTCPNHQGAWQRMRALTQQRTRQLTASVST